MHANASCKRATAQNKCSHTYTYTVHYTFLYIYVHMHIHMHIHVHMHMHVFQKKKTQQTNAGPMTHPSVFVHRYAYMCMYSHTYTSVYKLAYRPQARRQRVASVTFESCDCSALHEVDMRMGPGLGAHLQHRKGRIALECTRRSRPRAREARETGKCILATLGFRV